MNVTVTAHAVPVYRSHNLKINEKINCKSENDYQL